MITAHNVDQYIRSLIPKRDEVLTEMEDRAAREHIPIIGPVVGTLLSEFARAFMPNASPNSALRLDNSTIWLARAVAEGGTVLYTDGSEKYLQLADIYIVHPDGSGIKQLTQDGNFSVAARNGLVTVHR